METKQLAKLVDQKLQIILQIYQLAQEQARVVHGSTESGPSDQHEDSVSPLMQLLGQKQKLLASLHQVERRLDPFREQDPDTRHWANSEERRQCAQRVDQCQKVLAETLKIEKWCEQTMTERRDAVSRSIDAQRGAAVAQQAYANTGASSSSYSVFDAKE